MNNTEYEPVSPMAFFNNCLFYTYIYCTLYGQDQRVKSTFISIFYSAVLYLPKSAVLVHI